ncbi:MAG: hypothetical protein JW810_03050 [Sedimentisphaerales bacterium]|nr:hypothetical protein [Sedimentisphaerales bacterium]
MIPDQNLSERGLLIVTGTCLRAEGADRPLAYQLKQTIETKAHPDNGGPLVLVLSDLWYLAAEALHRLPMISVGGPGVNAVSAQMYKILQTRLVVDKHLMIQMDPLYQDLRVALWGTNHDLTVAAIDLFVQRGYLQDFLETIMARK